jgi:replication factor A1
MTVADLQPKQGNVELTLDITDKGDVRTFNKFGKEGRVCNATAKDDSGQITLSLWNEQIDQVSVGDKIKISNGWVSEWQGEKQLSTGKFGKLEVVGKAGEGAPAADASAEASAPAEPEAPTPTETGETPAEAAPEAPPKPEVAEEPIVEEETIQ